MKTPLVTVAIPSYNHAKYIAETIQSALDQTFQDFEILIVDDASTDNSIEVIKKFNDKRIRLIESQKNQGVCKTTDLCVENALGKYISLIASDDVMEKTKLEKQVNFLEQNPNYGAVFSGMEVIDENSRTNFKKTKKYTKVFEKENRNRFEWLNYFFYNGNCLAATSLLGKSEALRDVGKFNHAIIQAHDLDFWVRLCLKGYEIHIIHEKLLKYRERNNDANLSSNTHNTRIRLTFDNEKILRNFLTISSIKNLEKIFPKAYDSFGNIDVQNERTAIEYLLFKEAYKNDKSFYHRQFAITLLYEIMKRDGDLEFLNKNFGFGLKEYKEAVNTNPIGVLLEKLNNPLRKKFLKNCEKTLKRVFSS